MDAWVSSHVGKPVYGMHSSELNTLVLQDDIYELRVGVGAKSKYTCNTLIFLTQCTCCACAALCVLRPIHQCLAAAVPPSHHVF
jgi:hypothetical protein